MAYGIKYKASALSKNDNLYVLDIYEKDFVGDYIQIPTSLSPFV